MKLDLFRKLLLGAEPPESASSTPLLSAGDNQSEEGYPLLPLRSTPQPSVPNTQPAILSAPPTGEQSSPTRKEVEQPSLSSSSSSSSRSSSVVSNIRRGRREIGIREHLWQICLSAFDLLLLRHLKEINDLVLTPFFRQIYYVIKYCGALVDLLCLWLAKFAGNYWLSIGIILVTKSLPEKYEMTYPLFALSRLLLGTMYPAYASYKAVRTKNVREYVKWMMYWIVFAAFTCIETFTDLFVAFWLPFYYEIKMLLLIWLISPVSRGSLGSSMIYRKFVHPALTKREDEIDRMMLRLQDQGYNTITHFGGRAFNYLSNFVMQTAIRAPAILAEVAQDRTDGTRMAVRSFQFSQYFDVPPWAAGDNTAPPSSGAAVAEAEEEQEEPFQEEMGDMVDDQDEWMRPEAAAPQTPPPPLELDLPEDDGVAAEPQLRQRQRGTGSSKKKAAFDFSSDEENATTNPSQLTSTTTKKAGKRPTKREPKKATASKSGASTRRASTRRAKQ